MRRHFVRALDESEVPSVRNNSQSGTGDEIRDFVMHFGRADPVIGSTQNQGRNSDVAKARLAVGAVNGSFALALKNIRTAAFRHRDEQLLQIASVRIRRGDGLWPDFLDVACCAVRPRPRNRCAPNRRISLRIGACRRIDQGDRRNPVRRLSDHLERDDAAKRKPQHGKPIGRIAEDLVGQSRSGRRPGHIAHQQRLSG